MWYLIFYYKFLLLAKNKYEECSGGGLWSANEQLSKHLWLGEWPSPSISALVGKLAGIWIICWGAILAIEIGYPVLETNL